MGRLRYIEPELWSNADLRRLGWVARNVFLYLFSSHADDEGRFRWDCYAVLDGAFGRGDPVTEEQVASEMDALTEAGMLVRYGTQREFGFLTGWFVHQSMHKNVRRQSALPPPPVAVPSWSEADRVREKYGHSSGLSGSRCSYREAMRWFVENGRKAGRKSTKNIRRVSVEVETEGEGEGVREVENVNDQDAATSAIAEPALSLQGLEDQQPREPRSEQESLALRLWSAFGLPGQPPGGRGGAFGYFAQKCKAKTLSKVSEFVDAVEDSGWDETFDGTGDALTWFKDQTNLGLNCRPGQGWRRKPLLYESSAERPLQGWPSRFAVESDDALIGKFTDEELDVLARAPDNDWYSYPWHNVNGTEQQRAERARRLYQRDQGNA